MTESVSDLEKNLVHTGDCFEVVSDLPSESVHAVVTDPPYGLAFMGRDWDDFEPKEYQEWCEDWALEVKRVLKPGGHLLAFSGNRTHHRLFTGVEDAGFEIRDTITWHYGSGFPKASDISKTIDKRADAEREFTDGGSTDCEYLDKGMKCRGHGDETSQSGVKYHAPDGEPATDAAKRWDGWKTGLKPATEYVVMARKPFDGATVDCVQEHGTGALNIDATRINSDEELSRPSKVFGTGEDIYGEGNLQGEVNKAQDGRYPSNVVFGEQAAQTLDEEVGETPGQGLGGQAQNNGEKIDNDVYGDGYIRSDVGHDDYGGPSRYFYTSKASKAERTEDGSIANPHPTVKPVDLMEWLVELVTADEQVVLDPFAGSGTTLKAARRVGRQFVGVERQAKWADVARVRAGLPPVDPSHVRDADDNQTGIEKFGDVGR